MPGILQRFDISSDSLRVLESAVEMPFVWRSKGASFFSASDLDNSIQLLSYEPPKGYYPHTVTKLPYPLDTPSKCFSFLSGWLSNASYGPEPDRDGSIVKGWRITSEHSPASFLRLQTDWIVYGK